MKKPGRLQIIREEQWVKIKYQEILSKDGWAKKKGTKSQSLKKELPFSWPQ